MISEKSTPILSMLICLRFVYWYQLWNDPGSGTSLAWHPETLPLRRGLARMPCPILLMRCAVAFCEFLIKMQGLQLGRNFQGFLCLTGSRARRLMMRFVPVKACFVVLVCLRPELLAVFILRFVSKVVLFIRIFVSLTGELFA